jgi:cobalt-zinc-cadmium efflux system membrane fusion protein
MKFRHTPIRSSRAAPHRMRISSGASFVTALALGFALAGCGSEKPERAADMTSYSSKEAKGAAPELFTLPQEQMSHVQVVTVVPGKITRMLRLTGAVAYNAFATTPVITQVGGPVSRILVVPGEFVKQGQPLLEVSSPDYSQMLAVYLKAREVFRVASKNWDRAQDLYQHHAIAERDLLQAESDRNQAQADMNAADQSMKILGIPKPEDLEKSPSSAVVRLLAPLSGEVV